MAVHALRTSSDSTARTAEIPSATYATTAPTQPSEEARWTVSTNLRVPGDIGAATYSPATTEPLVMVPAAKDTCRKGPCSPPDRIMRTSTSTTTTTATIAASFTQRGVPG